MFIDCRKMKDSKLFTPVTLGPLTLRNRTIRSAAFESMCPGNKPSQMLLDYHRSVAAGGVGMTTVAYAAVTRSGLSFDRQLWMRPEIVPGLRRLTDAVHAEGAAAAIQLGHCGNMSHKSICGCLPVGASGGFNLYSPTFVRGLRAGELPEMAGLFFGHHGPFFMGKKEAVFTAHEVAFEEGEDDAWDKGELDEYGWPTHQEVAIDEDRPGVGVAPPDIDEIVDEGPAQAPDEHGGYKAKIEVKVHPFCLHEAEEKTGHSPIKGTFDHHRRKDRVKGRHAGDEAIEERGEKSDPEPEERAEKEAGDEDRDMHWGEDAPGVGDAMEAEGEEDPDGDEGGASDRLLDGREVIHSGYLYPVSG